MRVVNTVEPEDEFAVPNFGVRTEFSFTDDMEPEDFLSLLMRAAVFEQRTSEPGYPLITEDIWKTAAEY
jgi:hypothetical protein